MDVFFVQSRRFRGFWLVLCLLSFSWAMAQGSQSVAVDRLESIVALQAYDNDRGLLLPQYGSGTIISSNGYILTNYHVIADDNEDPYDYIAVSTLDPDDLSRAPQQRYWARFVSGFAQTDMALLEIVETLEGEAVDTLFRPLALGDVSRLELGESLRMLGYPAAGGDTITFTLGIFSGWLGEDSEGEGRRWLKSDTQISGGNSGGAALNVRGELVGIPTAVYSGEEGEFQAYLRPINLAFLWLQDYEAELLGLRMPEPLVDSYGEMLAPPPFRSANALADEVRREGRNPLPPRMPLQSGSPSGRQGDLQLGEAVEGVIAGGAMGEDASYHDYSLRLDRLQPQRLFVYLDGYARDADLALRFDDVIEDIDKVDYLDISTDLNSLYVLEPDMWEGAQSLELRVLNFYRSPLPYRLIVTPTPFKTAETDADLVRGPGEYGLVVLEDTLRATLAPAEQNDVVYHSYTLLVPEDTAAFSVRVSSDYDVDLAVNAADPIESFSSADFFDDSDSPEAEYRVDAPSSGLYYIDVVNLRNQAIPYTLELNLRDANGSDLSNFGMVRQIRSGERVREQLQGYSEGAGYHVYTLEVPAGQTGLEVKLQGEGDLDLALNYGRELPDYTLPEEGGEMDGYDFEPSAQARVRIDEPEAGLWYIEVINFSESSEAIPYTLVATLR